MLTGLYRLTGDTENAQRAAAEASQLRALPMAVLEATGLFAEGEITAAEKMIRAFLLEHGDDIEGMRAASPVSAQL